MYSRRSVQSYTLTFPRLERENFLYLWALIRRDFNFCVRSSPDAGIPRHLEPWIATGEKVSSEDAKRWAHMNVQITSLLSTSPVRKCDEVNVTERPCEGKSTEEKKYFNGEWSGEKINRRDFGLVSFLYLERKRRRRSSEEREGEGGRENC